MGHCVGAHEEDSYHLEKISKSLLPPVAYLISGIKLHFWFQKLLSLKTRFFFFIPVTHCFKRSNEINIEGGKIQF